MLEQAVEVHAGAHAHLVLGGVDSQDGVQLVVQKRDRQDAVCCGDVTFGIGWECHLLVWAREDCAAVEEAAGGRGGKSRKGKEREGEGCEGSA